MKSVKTITEINDSEIKEVKIVRNDEEANALLDKGWIYLSSGTSHIDQAGYNAKIHFVLGKIS